MRKYLLFIFVTFSLLFSNIIYASAECTTTKEDIEKVTVDYYREFGELDTTVLRVLNIPENTRVVIYDSDGTELDNNDNQEEYPEIFFFELDRSSGFFSGNIDISVELTNLCNNEKKTIPFKKDTYNVYSRSDICMSYPDLEICDSFYDVSEIESQEEYDELVKAEVQKIESKEKIKKDVKKTMVGNWVYFVIPFVITAIVAVIIVFVVKKVGKKHEEE